jgi:hypothetical protein
MSAHLSASAACLRYRRGGLSSIPVTRRSPLFIIDEWACVAPDVCVVDSLTISGHNVYFADTEGFVALFSFSLTTGPV